MTLEVETSAGSPTARGPASRKPRKQRAQAQDTADEGLTDVFLSRNQVEYRGVPGTNSGRKRFNAAPVARAVNGASARCLRGLRDAGPLAVGEPALVSTSSVIDGHPRFALKISMARLAEKPSGKPIAGGACPPFPARSHSACRF